MYIRDQKFKFLSSLYNTKNPHISARRVSRKITNRLRTYSTKTNGRYDCQSKGKRKKKIARTHHSNRCSSNPGSWTLSDKKSVSLGARVLEAVDPLLARGNQHCHSTTNNFVSRRYLWFRLKGRRDGNNANNGPYCGFHCVAIDFTGIMIHVRNQFWFSSRGTDALSKNAACVCAQAAFCSMQASSGDCRFFRQSAAPGLSLPPPWRHRESRLQPRIYAITAPLPPPMLHCAEVYGYRFPVASSFQSGHPNTVLLPSIPSMLILSSWKKKEKKKSTPSEPGKTISYILHLFGYFRRDTLLLFV